MQAIIVFLNFIALTLIRNKPKTIVRLGLVLFFALGYSGVTGLGHTMSFRAFNG
jgi:hypothetical protein